MGRAQRLRHGREFAAVYRRGRAYRSELVMLRALRTGEPVSRAGFTAGRVLGGAVVRNRVKRRLREAVRALALAPGWDLVLNARRGAVGADYARLYEAVADLARRAGVTLEGKEAALG